MKIREISRLCNLTAKLNNQLSSYKDNYSINRLRVRLYDLHEELVSFNEEWLEKRTERK